jgi:hypothetical protein
MLMYSLYIIQTKLFTNNGILNLQLQIFTITLVKVKLFIL